ncbi:MAG TPA: hypothetical protein VGB56_14440, partial [Flavisolibacter sp.]
MLIRVAAGLFTILPVNENQSPIEYEEWIKAHAFAGVFPVRKTHSPEAAAIVEATKILSLEV